MKMKILISALLSVFVLVSCYEDPIGLDDNINIIPLEDSIPKPDVKTKFRADTVVCEFIEKIRIINREDTMTVHWEPLLLDAYGAIDTLGGLNLINFSINAQRTPDTLAEFRKEHILGFHLNLDSFKIGEKFNAEKNNIHYSSKLVLQMLPSRKIEAIHGNYPIVITFREPIYESRMLILRGRFQIDVPIGNSSQKYNYLFVGEFHIRFKLE